MRKRRKRDSHWGNSPSERLHIEARTMGGRDVEVEVEVEKVVSAERSGVERIRYGAKRSGREVEVDR